MAHIDAGKTTTTERILYYSGENHKIGNVDDGNTTTDWLEEEKERGITIQSAAVTVTWKKKQINIIDTPGHVDFTAEVERSLRVLDGAIAIFCAVSGVQPQSETVWKQSRKYKVPKIGFINKMDRMGADFFRVAEEIEKKLSTHTVAMTIPYGSESSFKGVIDVLEKKYLTFTSESLGADVVESEIPSDAEELIKKYYEKLIEEASRYSDDIMMKYLEGEEISKEEILIAIKKGVLEDDMLPLYAGSSLKNIGVQPLMDAIVYFLPSPLESKQVTAINVKNNDSLIIKADENAPLAALVFKVQNDIQAGLISYVRVYAGVMKKGVMIYNSTRNIKERAFRILRMSAGDKIDVPSLSAGDIGAVIGFKNAYTADSICTESNKIYLEKPIFPAPVISVAVETVTAGESEKLKNTLEILSHEDPTFTYKENKETGQIVISGMGELHLEVLLSRIKKEFSIDVNTGNPQVSYRESIRDEGEDEFEFERMIAGKNAYASVRLHLSADDNYNQNSINIDKNVLKNTSEEFINAAKEQLNNSLKSGIEFGYECTGINVLIKDIKIRDDSTQASIAAATALCFDNLSRSLHPLLLEPVMTVFITTPADFVGECINALNKRGGIVENIENRADDSTINATAPLKNLFGFTTALRSSSQGRASFIMSFKKYSVQEGGGS